MKINERRKCMILFKNLLRLAFEGGNEEAKTRGMRSYLL